MTRKHFEALANGLAAVRPQDRQSDAYAQWISDVLIVSGVCATSNPAFDRDRFFDACVQRGRRAGE